MKPSPHVMEMTSGKISSSRRVFLVLATTWKRVNLLMSVSQCGRRMTNSVQFVFLNCVVLSLITWILSPGDYMSMSLMSFLLSSATFKFLCAAGVHLPLSFPAGSGDWMCSGVVHYLEVPGLGNILPSAPSYQTNGRSLPVTVWLGRWQLLTSPLDISV